MTKGYKIFQYYILAYTAKTVKGKKSFHEGPRPGSNHTPAGPAQPPRPRYSGSTRPRPSRWADIRVQMATCSQNLFPNFCQMHGRKWVFWSTYIAAAVPLKKPKKNNSPERAKNTILLFLHSSSLSIHQASTCISMSGIVKERKYPAASTFTRRTCLLATHNLFVIWICLWLSF